VLRGAPLPFKIVFGIELEVLPAVFGFVAALVIGIEIPVSKRVNVTAIDIRIRFKQTSEIASDG
jgi:hypothetical protein